MNIAWEVIDLQTKHPFVIARGRYTEHRNIVVKLTGDDGVEGWGEAAPNAYYGESVAKAVQTLDYLRRDSALEDGDSIQGFEMDLEMLLDDEDKAVRAAIISALYDMHGKRHNGPVWKLWGLDAELVPESSYTIPIAELEDIRELVLEASDYPILKVKLGAGRDEEIIRIVRETAPDKVICVDANAGWKSASHAFEMLTMLANYQVEFAEQPLPPDDKEGYKTLARMGYDVPLIADESCIVAEDIPELVGLFDGINIKLAKCGSLTEALRMAHTARACGMMVMAGCMIESSLGISAIAQIAPLLDWADFDGAALLSNDPFKGVTIEGGNIKLNTAPGLGVTRIAHNHHE